MRSGCIDYGGCIPGPIRDGPIRGGPYDDPFVRRPIERYW